jgi:hypothetical protein
MTLPLKKLLPPDFFLKISPVPKIPRKYSITNRGLSFFSFKKLTKLRSERGEEEIKPNSIEIESINSPNTNSGLQNKKMQTKHPEKEIFVIKSNLKVMKRNTVSVVKTFRRQLRKMTGSNV